MLSSIFYGDCSRNLETIDNLQAAVRSARELFSEAHHITALANPEIVNQRLLQYYSG